MENIGTTIDCNNKRNTSTSVLIDGLLSTDNDTKLKIYQEETMSIINKYYGEELIEYLFHNTRAMAIFFKKIIDCVFNKYIYSDGRIGWEVSVIMDKSTLAPRIATVNIRSGVIKDNGVIADASTPTAEHVVFFGESDTSETLKREPPVMIDVKCITYDIQIDVTTELKELVDAITFGVAIVVLREIEHYRQYLNNHLKKRCNITYLQVSDRTKQQAIDRPPHQIINTRSYAKVNRALFVKK